MVRAMGHARAVLSFFVGGFLSCGTPPMPEPQVGGVDVAPDPPASPPPLPPTDAGAPSVEALGRKPEPPEQTFSEPIREAFDRYARAIEKKLAPEYKRRV